MSNSMRASDRTYQAPRSRPVVHTGDQTRTQQHHAKSADLNEIVRRFGVAGKPLPVAAPDPSYYGDFSDAVDFREALDRTRAAQEHFEGLPAEIRNRFANDPVRLLGFVMDPENVEESVKLGLLHKRNTLTAEPVTAAPEPSTNETAA